LALQNGTPYFANLALKEGENSAFSASGVKLATDLTGDWETDTLRTGCLGDVTINLPRIGLECEKDKYKFQDLLKERFELAARALQIKNNALKQFGKKSLPFLLQKTSGDTYFRLENCSRIISLVGLSEAIEVFTGKSLNSEESQVFAEEIVTSLTAFKQKIGRKYGRDFIQLSWNCRRLGTPRATDIEKYGVAKVRFQEPETNRIIQPLRGSNLKTQIFSFTNRCS
jgi:ribonucleoside-triphosphate reductase